MGLFDFFIGGKKPQVAVPEPQIIEGPTKQSSYSGGIIPLGSIALPFDGEKNLGEMGPATSYVPNYYLLSTRSWQAYTDSPLAKTVIDKWINWIMDSGLKLKTNPAKIVLKTEGIDLDKDETETFNDIVEMRWDVWSNSKNSTFTGEETFNEASKSIYLNSKISGDVLVILRYVDNTVKIQYIDGSRVQNPMGSTIMTADGNILCNGVKLSPTGRVLGYHVRMKDALSFEYISAVSSKTNLRMAFLVKGSKWRMDYHRGLPVIATALETLSKLDRYREATVGSAEEVAKVAFQVVHQNYSDGSNPLQQTLVAAFNNNTKGSGGLPTDEAGQQLADRVAVTTNKTAYNNPKGAKIETIAQSNNVTGFESFYSSQANIVCACIGIPPNIAMSLYNDSFSASRAATKDWDHTMDIERVDFTNQFLQHVYKFWLYVEILKNKIPAKGYLQAFQNNDFMITEAYEKMRFTGPHFPHIDPVKEVKAEREKLGKLFENVSLTTLEQATENLGGGDSDSNMEQVSDELKRSKELKLVPAVTDEVKKIDLV